MIPDKTDVPLINNGKSLTVLVPPLSLITTLTTLMVPESPEPPPDAKHVGTVISVLFNVTAPFLARSLPLTVEPPSSVIEVRARMVPVKEVVVPSVAELPTCQKTLQAWAPPVRVIVASVAVVRVEPAWKIQMSEALPLRVSVPVTPILEADL